MKATGGAILRFRQVRAIVLVPTLAAAIALIGVGPASAQGRAQRARSNAINYDFNVPTSAAVAGPDLFVTNGGGNSVTELSASSGAYVARISSHRFKFNRPSAIETVGSDLFVTNAGGNSVTEFSAGSLKHIRTVHRSKYHLSDPLALAASGPDLFVLNGTGSVTEIATASGALIGTVSGVGYGFHNPTGIAVTDGKVFVANSTVNTVTVFSATTRALVGILSGPSYSFSTPTGLAVDGANDVWVTNYNGSSVTEISAATLVALNVVVSGNLPWVGPITYGDGYVFTVSPPGGSPMVSQITPSPPPTVPWMMCNTNGPYLFNNPQAAVVSGTSLWIVNEGSNSLTQMDTDSGALIRTVFN